MFGVIEANVISMEPVESAVERLRNLFEAS